jgi:hypothetical protein
MSCLKLYWPQTLSLYRPADADWSSPPEETDAPVILAFPRPGQRRGGRQSRMLDRARLIRENRCCPECGRAAVVPVNAEPLLMSRNQMPVPGSGRLIGFECDGCGHAWGIES